MQNNELSAPARTIVEIKASILAHARNAATEIIWIGADLADAKEQLPHGGWLPFLNEVGISASTAENYMRLAREIAPASPLAALPYTKALALLSLPEGERESFAEANNVADKSAKAIRDLVNEKNRLAEEKLMLEHQLRDARTKAGSDKMAADALRQQVDNLLNNPVEKVVEKTVEKVVAPPDYAELKRIRDEYEQDIEQAAQAAIAAEEKSRKLEEEVHRLKEGGMDPNQDPEEYAVDCFSQAAGTFLSAVRNYPQRYPAFLVGNYRSIYEMHARSLEALCRDMRKVFAMADEAADAEAVIS